jgi:hypothetical protein
MATSAGAHAHDEARPPSLGAAWAALIDAGLPPGVAWSVVREEPTRLLRAGLAPPMRLAA